MLILATPKQHEERALGLLSTEKLNSRKKSSFIAIDNFICSQPPRKTRNETLNG
jgi:hypothetical protein